MAIIAQPIGTGMIDRVEGGSGTMVVLIAMVILFGAATYFTGRLYGKAGYITCGIGFVLVCVTLAFLGGMGIIGYQ
ncbi:MAG TPA: hypothetical protein VHT02_06565 [Methylocella sp.]|jgi:hypothetical protein|nr:hypothetical protein [Methylocella sp.]